MGHRLASRDPQGQRTLSRDARPEASRAALPLGKAHRPSQGASTIVRHASAVRRPVGATLNLNAAARVGPGRPYVQLKGRPGRIYVEGVRGERDASLFTSVCVRVPVVSLSALSSLYRYDLPVTFAAIYVYGTGHIQYDKSYSKAHPHVQL